MLDCAITALNCIGLPKIISFSNRLISLDLHTWKSSHNICHNSSVRKLWAFPVWPTSCFAAVILYIQHHAILVRYILLIEQNNSYFHIPLTLSWYFLHRWSAQHLYKTPDITTCVYMHWHGQHKLWLISMHLWHSTSYKLDWEVDGEMDSLTLGPSPTGEELLNRQLHYMMTS